MQSYQWFLLGMMTAWMPSLLLLAWMLRHAATNNGYPFNRLERHHRR